MNNVYIDKELTDIYNTNHLHVHNIIVKNKIVTPPEEILRFNHYNVKIKDIPQNEQLYDDCMKQYKDLFIQVDGFTLNDNYYIYEFVIFFIFVIACIVVVRINRNKKLLYSIFATLLIFSILCFVVIH